MPVADDRPPHPKYRLLLSIWVVTFALGVLCASVVVEGLWRDHRGGEPRVAVDFSRHGFQASDAFRVWGAGQYKLFVSAVNHDEKRVGAPLNAEFEVVIAAPDRVVFRRLFAPGATGLAVPSNYGDATLTKLAIDGSPLRPWSLDVRVTKGDPAFRDIRAEIKFWKERYDPGMGGLMNYVMIIPALVLAAIAFILAVILAGRGVRSPLWVTSAACALVVAALAVR